MALESITCKTTVHETIQEARDLLVLFGYFPPASVKKGVVMGDMLRDNTG